VEYNFPGKGWLWGETRSKDISLGGIQFQVDGKIELGSRIALRIRIPNWQRPTTAAGEIVWIKQARAANNKYNIGVRFTQADPFDLEKLLKQLGGVS
ncbi:MAG: PilZ domain-containing protein, partial [Candidatus Omnitrophota bacterium]